MCADELKLPKHIFALPNAIAANESRQYDESVFPGKGKPLLRTLGQLIDDVKERMGEYRKFVGEQVTRARQVDVELGKVAEQIFTKNALDMDNALSASEDAYGKLGRDVHNESLRWPARYAGYDLKIAYNKMLEQMGHSHEDI